MTQQNLAQATEDARVYAGVILCVNWTRLIVRDGERSVVYDRVLPNDLNYVLREIGAWRDAVDEVLVALDYDGYKLIETLVANGLSVSVLSTATLASYRNQEELDVERLADVLDPRRCSEQQKIRAEILLRYTNYACHMVQGCGELLRKHGGAAMRDAFDLEMQQLIRARGWSVESSDGDVRVRSLLHSLAECNDFVEAASDYTSRIVGNRVLEAQIARLHQEFQQVHGKTGERKRIP